MQKKVMILTPFYGQIGGAETFADELLWQVIKSSYPVWICTINYKGVWKGINWIKGFVVVFDLFLYALLDCFNYKPDTVHALGFNAAFVGAILKPFYKFKLIVTPLALYDFNNKLLYHLVRWTLKRTDIIFAESELSKENLSRVANKDKIKVFTHWVNTKKFYPIQIAEKQPCWMKATVRGPGGHGARPMRGGTLCRS